MKNRPLIIKIIALLYFIAPLGIIVELMWLYKIPMSRAGAVFSYEYWNWHVLVMTVLTPVIGYCVWSVKKWGYYILLAHSFLVLVNNFVLYANSLTFSSIGIIIVFNLFILTVIVLFVRKEVYAPYFNPNIRWWEQAKRFLASDVKILIKEFGKNDLLFTASSFDLSETGIFVATEYSVKVGEVYGLEIHLTNDSILYADAEVVWVNQGLNDFPKGFGCKILASDNIFKKRIRFHVRDISARERERK